jgi:hypothetical protein
MFLLFFMSISGFFSQGALLKFMNIMVTLH